MVYIEGWSTVEPFTLSEVMVDIEGWSTVEPFALSEVMVDIEGWSTVEPFTLSAVEGWSVALTLLLMKSLCTHFRKLPKIQQLLIDVYFLLFQSHGLFYIRGWSGPT